MHNSMEFNLNLSTINVRQIFGFEIFTFIWYDIYIKKGIFFTDKYIYKHHITLVSTRIFNIQRNKAFIDIVIILVTTRASFVNYCFVLRT